jgi:hypothetical protein
MSSNSREKYVVNAFETVAVPRGTVQHHRYQLKYIDPDLRSSLPKHDETVKTELAGSEVVACYLYQERGNDKWQWINIYPLRNGTLQAAYKTGDGDEDVAHFYFKTAGYYNYGAEAINLPKLNSAVQAAIAKQVGRSYASFGDKFEPIASDIGNDESAFHTLSEALSKHYPEHFKTPESMPYLPVLCFIRGLYQGQPKGESKRVRLEPGYDDDSHESIYELTEGCKYTYEFSYYFPESFPPPSGDSVITLTHDDKFFASTPDTLNANSRYDEKECLVLPGAVESDTWSSLRFHTKIDALGVTVLNLSRSFPVVIKPRVLRRRLLKTSDIIGDIGLGASTAGITLWTTINPWYAPVLASVGFVLYITSKAISIFEGTTK